MPIPDPMATPTSPTHALAGPALDNRRIAAGAIDLAAPLAAGLALLVTDLLTPLTALVLVGWTLYYFFALESGGGQTLGKRAMNLRVVSADGGQPTMRQYAMRTLARVIDTPAIGLVVMLATGDRRQRLGDMAGHTSVVDAKGGESAMPQMDAFDAAHLHTNALTQPAEPRPKRSRPSLGGPELKMPSLRRSKDPKPPKAPKQPKAAKPAKQPKAAKSGRPTLGGPELKLPSLRRSKTPREPKPAKQPKPAKAGRPTLGGPEIKLPSFGRKKKQAPVVAPPAIPEPPAAAEPLPAPVPAAEPDMPEIPAFDPFSDDAPEPSVEVVSHGNPEPPDEPPAPEPVPPAMPAPPPVAAHPSIPAIEPEPEPEPEPAPTASNQPEPEHVEGVRDDGSPRVNVKPIETVSAMELLMREAEEQGRQR